MAGESSITRSPVYLTHRASFSLRKRIKIFVSSGQGKVYIYDGKSYDQIATVDFQGGADNLRYDAGTKRVYVGCRDDEKTGAIAVIDATADQRTADVYQIGGEPESFQLEKMGPNIYVNVP